jgi:hypothetical protein
MAKKVVSAAPAYALAVHTVHIKRGDVSHVIPASTPGNPVVFKATDDEYAAGSRVGALREPTEEELDVAQARADREGNSLDELPEAGVSGAPAGSTTSAAAETSTPGAATTTVTDTSVEPPKSGARKDPKGSPSKAAAEIDI